jgi:hypothetical protein
VPETALFYKASLVLGDTFCRKFVLMTSQMSRKNSVMRNNAGFTAWFTGGGA